MNNQHYKPSQLDIKYRKHTSLNLNVVWVATSTNPSAAFEDKGFLPVAFWPLVQPFVAFDLAAPHEWHGEDDDDVEELPVTWKMKVILTWITAECYKIFKSQGSKKIE